VPGFFGIVAFVQSTIWSSVLSWEPSKVRQSKFESGLDHCNYYAAYWSQAEWDIFKKNIIAIRRVKCTYTCYNYVRPDGNIVIVLFVTVFMMFNFFIQQFVDRVHWNICLVVHPNIIRTTIISWIVSSWIHVNTQIVTFLVLEAQLWKLSWWSIFSWESRPKNSRYKIT